LLLAFIGFVSIVFAAKNPYVKPIMDGGITPVVFDVISDSSGDYTKTFNSINGFFVGITIDPNTGDDQPTDQFDLSLTNQDGVAIDDDALTNMSNASAVPLVPKTNFSYFPVAGGIILTGSNLGANKVITVTAYFQESYAR